MVRKTLQKLYNYFNPVIGSTPEEALPKLSSKDNKALYKHLMNIWGILPVEVQQRFRKENGCVLCPTHHEHISKIQAEVLEDRRLNMLRMAIKEEQELKAKQKQEKDETKN